MNKGLSLIEVLLTIILIGAFSGVFMICIGNSSRAGYMFCTRVQATNLARARICELRAVPVSMLANPSPYNVDELDWVRGFSFSRRTVVTDNGSSYRIDVTVSNGSFNDDGTMGSDVTVTAYRAK